MATKETIYFAKTEITQKYLKGTEELTDKINDTWLICPDKANPDKNYWVALSLETAKVGFANSEINAYSSLLVGIISALRYRKTKNLTPLPLGIRAEEGYRNKLSQAIPLDYDKQTKNMLEVLAMFCPDEPNVIKNDTINFGKEISIKIIKD